MGSIPNSLICYRQTNEGTLVFQLPKEVLILSVIQYIYIYNSILLFLKGFHLNDMLYGLFQ